MLKTFFATLREALWSLIGVLAALALFAAVLAPERFAGRMAGIFDALEREGFDIKIKTPVGEASFERVKEQQLVSSDSQILELRRELSAARGRVALLETTAGLSAVPPAPELGSEGDEAVVERAPVPWVVIAGTERDLEGQRDALNALKRAGIERAVILNTGGWYQSAVIYDGKDRAQEALARVSDIVGADRGAYIRALDVVCQQMQPVPGDPDLRRCG